MAELAPDQPEVLGLLALLELQASRTAARTDAQGQPVLLAEQDRGRWDAQRIQHGLAALSRANALTTSPRTYHLQAAIAACHARAARHEDTDWARIAVLYGRLMSVAPSPVVELNRAVAVAMNEGPAAGLVIVERLVDDPALRHYPWLAAVRGDLLARLGRRSEAERAFQAAADLTGNAKERALLLRRARDSGTEGLPRR